MNTLQKLALATGNAGKLREFQHLLQPFGFEVLPQSEFGIDGVEETGLSFLENALLKARHAAKVSGLAALADDSGISVDALAGRPGIHSARFAGPVASDADNNQLLLERLADVPEPQRTARYHCLLVFLRDPEDPVPIICDGSWEGRILREPKGNGGFGYDPLFLPEGMQQTAAELDPDEKNRISHRGRAMQELSRRLT